MLKLDILKASKEAIGGGLYAGALYLAALTGVFITFPEHPWPFVFGLLYLGHIGSLIGNQFELREKRDRRLAWLDSLTLRKGMSALHAGDRDHYGSDTEFWVAMYREAREEVEFEDGVQVAGADLDGKAKPRAVWTFLSNVASDAFLVGLALLLASAIRANTV